MTMRIWGQDSLRKVWEALHLREFASHYNRRRPHRALGLRPPLPRGQPLRTAGEVVGHDRLGRVVHEYERAAA